MDRMSDGCVRAAAISNLVCVPISQGGLSVCLGRIRWHCVHWAYWYTYVWQCRICAGGTWCRVGDNLLLAVGKPVDGRCVLGW